MNRRRQLTMFIDEPYAKAIENTRWLYNMEQYNLIRAHVTVCREDELTDMDKLRGNLSSIKHGSLRLTLLPPVRFANGKGVMLPVKENCETLRNEVLSGIAESPRLQMMHITLMHPRNANCTDAIYETILNTTFPAEIILNKISLIEQVDNEAWQTLDEFPLLIN